MIDTWMDEALKLARKAALEDEVPVGAVVIFENRIIGRGYNQREKLQSPVAHAEVLAIENASRELGSWRLEGCQLVVTLEPCPMCLACSQQARIERVIYGCDDPKGGALSLGYPFHEDKRTNHRFPVELVATPECSHVLKEFFKKKRKKN